MNYKPQFDAISEDTINCFYFSTEANDDISYWDNLCIDINKTIQNLSSEYLWHKDKLEVFPQILNEEQYDSQPHLFSSTCYGDNIEDEWFIVYIIFELTKQFDKLIVHVTDIDGDFILIEAADFLPQWMNPVSTEKRVFIFKGEVHIIPETLVGVDTDLDFSDSIKYIINHPQETKASDNIQSSIAKRIAGYPAKIKENIHRAIIELPLDAAAVLSIDPSLISHVVNAYCHHDVIDEKVCKNIKFQDTTCIKLSFTRCQYAMLTHSKDMKTLTHTFASKKDKKSILGLKLYCGYKIILNEVSDIFNSKEYAKYISSLKSNGYFKGNIDGSKDYVALLEKAKEYFVTMLTPSNKNISNKMNQIIASEEFQRQKDELKNRMQDSDEDSDDWLNINPEQLNELLNSRYGKQANIKDELTPQSISKHLSSFLHKSSDFEGIELNDQDDEIHDDKIEFDCEGFSDALQDMLKLISSNNAQDIDSGNDLSDDELEKNLDYEIKESLSTDMLNEDPTERNKSMFNNIMQSIKEEEGFTGPSSNLLNSIGIKKNDLLDSDDDDE
ncbi:hypothetical protein JYU34_021140 [Plutella xylostella]|uniref:Uncharacterized protein n=1 Tax=Plutella xylostella TaxID=51655 RepID=A0ABQ7PU52_PLUXY|nr:hypothetical protein JYU34_021140 [Plutella xylostella]